MYQYFFFVFLIFLGLHFIWTEILFSIDHHWINLCWITFLFNFYFMLQLPDLWYICSEVTTHLRNIQTCDWVIYGVKLTHACVSGIGVSDKLWRLGWRHFVVGRLDSSQLRFLLLQLEIPPAQQEGYCVFTKLQKQ